MRELLLRMCRHETSFNLFLWLLAAIQCLDTQDCQLPVKPIYGEYHVNGSELMYYCMDGYGLIGLPIRYCFSGKWQTPSPVCVKAATPLGNSEQLKLMTDNNLQTCFDFRMFSTYTSNPPKDRLIFSFNRNISDVIIRISVVGAFSNSYFQRGLDLRFSVNGEMCINSREIDRSKNGIGTYDYSCSLYVRSNPIEVDMLNMPQYPGYAICEMQVLLNEKVACPLAGHSVVNGIIKYDPNVFRDNAPYGTAAIYKCNENRTLRGSEIRYCIQESQWSGEETFCEVYKSEISKENSKTIPTFIFIIIGILAVVVLLLTLVVVTLFIRRKRKKKTNKTRVKVVCQLEEVNDYEYVSSEAQLTNRPSQEPTPMYITDLVEITNSFMVEEAGYLVPIKKNQITEDINTRNIDQNDDISLYCSLEFQEQH